MWGNTGNIFNCHIKPYSAAYYPIPKSHMFLLCFSGNRDATRVCSKNLRALWSEEDLQNAIADVRNDTGSVRLISRTYKVLGHTLMIRLRSGYLNKGELGYKGCLGSDHEGEILGI